jgi:phage portal protein BeeE
MAFERIKRALRTARAGVVEMVDRAVRPSWAMYSTYGEPAAERLLTSFDEYVEKAYAGNGVVFGVLNVQMRLFSEARFKLRRTSDKKLVDDEALHLLQHPWPNGDTGTLLARARQDASIAGNAYVRDAGDRLERLRPDWVTIVSEVVPAEEAPDGHQIRKVIGYVYDPVGDPERDIDFFPESEVAHFAPIPDPSANWRGMSVLTPVIKEINADKSMTDHRDAFFRRAATPNVIIKYKDRVDPSKRKRIIDAIHAGHGGPERAGGTLVLDEGADPLIVGSRFTDAQFEEIQAAGENRIAVAAGVPALVAGLKLGLDDAAWSMYRQALRAFVDLSVRPDWRSLCAAVAGKLVDVPDGYELWIDTSDITALQEGEKEQAEAQQVQAAVMSTLITAGFEPESVVAAVNAGDMTLLKHTGLVSVQMHDPTKPPPEPAPPGQPDPGSQPENEDQADEDDGDQDDQQALRAALWEVLRAWEERRHPRWPDGRFRPLGSADLDGLDVGEFSDRRLYRLFENIAGEQPDDEAGLQRLNDALVRLNDELQRREQQKAARRSGNPLAGVNLAELSEQDLSQLWTRHRDREDVWRPISAEMARRWQADEDRDRAGFVDWTEHGGDTLAQRRIDKAVAAGADYRDAYASAYATSRDDLLADEQRALVDVDRRAGESRRQAVRRAYGEYISLQYLAAETATRGHLLTPAGRAAGIDAVSLFSGRRDRARKWASEDLRRWWEENPRLTFTEFAHAALGGDGAAAERIRLGGRDQDFGV